MYNEAADFADHVEQIRRMDTALGAVGISIEWSSTSMCDVGGGGGVHAGLLACRAKRVHCADIIDQHARYGGEFGKLLREKLARYQFDLPLERLEFNVADAMNAAVSWHRETTNTD